MNEPLKVTGIILQISEATKKRNPAIFRANSHAGACAKKPESDGRGEGEDRGVAEIQKSIRYSIEIIMLRPRLLDDGDNDRSSVKPLRDRIAGFLRFYSDDDPRLEWRYSQIKSPNKGVTVIIWEITKEGLK